MQEYHVTAAGRTYPLERPFFVLATQNPIELEGTYPLPEAQLDRFMFNIVMTYLSEDEEVRVVTQTTGVATQPPARVFSGADILEIQQLVRQVVVAEEVARYAVRLVDASRPGRQSDHEFVPRLGEVGRRPARVAVADPRRQGARADARPLSRVGRATSRRWRARCCATASSRTSTPSPSASPPTICRAAARGGARAAQRDVADARRPAARDLRFLDPGRHRAARDDGAEGADGRRGVSLGPASQPVQGVQRRVRRVPPVPARRRSVHARLEGLRAHRSPLRQEVRGGDQPRVPPAARRRAPRWRTAARRR